MSQPANGRLWNVGADSSAVSARRAYQASNYGRRSGYARRAPIGWLYTSLYLYREGGKATPVYHIGVCGSLEKLSVLARYSPVSMQRDLVRPTSAEKDNTQRQRSAISLGNISIWAAFTGGEHPVGSQTEEELSISAAQAMQTDMCLSIFCETCQQRECDRQGSGRLLVLPCGKESLLEELHDLCSHSEPPANKNMTF